MRINNNLMAMNTHRQLGIATNGGAKSMEKLSSGFRINRAGDDAAGLAISEKMRGQIRGLTQASRNAQDGISLIQTAEGALDETHAILQRMRELAVQASTDTNTPEDRAEIQKEVDQLATEITRISETTQFNTMNLLDGTYADKKFHIGANSDQNTTIAISNMSAKALVVGEELTVSGSDLVNSDGDTVYKFYAEGAEIHAAITETGKEAAAVVADKTGYYAVTAQDVTNFVQGTAALWRETEAAFTDEEVSVGINVSTQEAADSAITTINDAISTVSSERSKLGAMQNRLEHTIKNLDNTAENLQAAEARIRDVDMAKEMMEQTKQNILQQASTAMLAQANQAPQTVLQLLR